MHRIPARGGIHSPALLPAFLLALAFSSALHAGAPRDRWSEEAVWVWYKARPWICGFNYVPSTAANTTEFWQAETFDPATIERELGWARDIGFNSCRVFIQYLVWKHDPEGLRKRLGRFLEIAAACGITVLPVLFDDCAFGDPPITEPYLGKQRDPIPGMILPSWTPSPGLKAVTDRTAWPDLERYVKDLVGAFGADRRILFWDLYNEPGNSGMGVKSLPLVEVVFDWARAARPEQPLTVSVWGAGPELDRRQIERSDFPSFHAYADAKGLRAAIDRLRPFRRPVVSTEWMARPQGSRWETDLPLLKEEGVGCYAWGFVNGRGQCQFPWWSKRGDPEPEVWFHDILRREGTPWRPAEVESIRKVAAEKRLDVSAAERFFARLGPGWIGDTDPRLSWSGPWTAWMGEGPAAGTLHYAKEASARCEFAFEGTGVRLIHKVGPDCGIAEILVDGKPAGTPLDTFGPDVDWGREVALASGLPEGRHRVTVTATGRKREVSTEAWVQIVGFRIEPPPEGGPR